MNKLTKNKIFFNLEKIIALTTVTTIIILTISLLSSCSNSKTLVHKKPLPYYSNYSCE